MRRFIEMKRPDGKAVLVNIDRVDTATFDEENNTVTLFTPEGEMTFIKDSKEFREEIEDDTLSRISGNLFHIWEILRARLH